MNEIITQDIFGKPIKREYSEIGSARVNGYENEYGSWAASYLGQGWWPCTQIAIKFKRKRKFVWVSRSRIIECKQLGIKATV